MGAIIEAGYNWSYQEAIEKSGSEPLGLSGGHTTYKKGADGLVLSAAKLEVHLINEPAGKGSSWMHIQTFPYYTAIEVGPFPGLEASKGLVIGKLFGQRQIEKVLYHLVGTKANIQFFRKGSLEYISVTHDLEIDGEVLREDNHHSWRPFRD